MTSDADSERLPPPPWWDTSWAVAGAAVVLVLAATQRRSSVEEEYDEAAASFDEQWSEYVNVTVEAMLERLGPKLQELPCAASTTAPCRLLDVGCGTGALAEAVASRFPAWRVVCSDLSAEMLTAAATKGLETVMARSEALPFGAHEFDVVTSLSSFHFWDEPLLGLAEIHRVLRPGGSLLLSDWSHDFLSCKLCSLWLWLRGFPANDYSILSAERARALMEEARFDVVEEHVYLADTRPWGLPVLPVVGNRINWGMFAFCATKPQ